MSAAFQIDMFGDAPEPRAPKPTAPLLRKADYAHLEDKGGRWLATQVGIVEGFYGSEIAKDFAHQGKYQLEYTGPVQGWKYRIVRIRDGAAVTDWLRLHVIIKIAYGLIAGDLLGARPRLT